MLVAPRKPRRHSCRLYMTARFIFHSAHMTGTSARDAAVATRHVTIARCRYGPMMWLNSDRVIGECLRLYGEFAEGEVRLLLSLLKPGDVVLDAGAHIGTLAVPLALAVGAQGRVIAFEPQRMSYACLCANLTKRGLHWAEARRGALGARAAHARRAPAARRAGQ